MEKTINTQAQPIPQRNDPCPCGSGKKFKKCCINTILASTKIQANPFEDCINSAQHAIYKNDFSKAERYFREALSHRKNSAIALAGLGQSLCQLHRIEEGIAFLSQAGKALLKKAAQTGDIQHPLDLAYQLMHWRAAEEALILSKGLLALDKNSAAANHIAAMSLQALNKPSEAYTFAKRATELAPNDANANILLAILESKLGKLTEAKARLELLVSKPIDTNTARAHLELGVILDKLKEFDSAFNHLTTAGKLTLESPAARRINKSGVYQEINQFKTAFNPAFLKSGRQRITDDGLPSPVFLIGFYRSGTTLAEQILAAHDRIISSDEAHLISHVLIELQKITKPNLTLPERIQSLDSDQITHLRQVYWQTAKRTLGEHVMQKILLDKTALNTLNIELINTLFPDSIIIFAIRDPRDVCLSCFMQSFSLSPLTINFLDWADCARFYALIMDYWLSIRDSLSIQWLELRYEDVLNDLEGQFSPIFSKIGLEWSEECRQFYLHSQRKVIKTPSFDQVTQPLYSTSKQRWRHYKRHYPLIQPMLEPYIKAFGYDL